MLTNNQSPRMEKLVRQGFDSPEATENFVNFLSYCAARLNAGDSVAEIWTAWQMERGAQT